MNAQRPTEKKDPTPAISKENRVGTLINEFTAAAANQQKLADRFIEATEKTMKHASGLFPRNLHKGLDGARVVNDAHWRTRAAFEAMPKNPAAQVHMKPLVEISHRTSTCMT